MSESTTPNDGFGDVEESIELPESALTERDQEELDRLLAEKPEIEYHSIFKVWQSLLESADTAGNRHMTPKWAMAIIGQYVGITFSDLDDYVVQYFNLLDDMRLVLQRIIDEDEDTLKPKSADEDIEVNHSNYVDVLREWQLLLLTRELTWSPSSPTAAVEIAVLSEIQKLFFGQTGLVGHLEAIKLEYSDEDQESLAVALEARRDELMGAK